MAEFTSHQPGTFCWIELGTSDAAAAKKFYVDLFGWSVKENPMGEVGTYYIFQKNDKDCAAMYQLGPMHQGMPPMWWSYVAVASADDATAKAKSLGANIMNGPFDVFDMGRMSIVSDPQGAAFAIWEAKKSQGLHVRDESNTLCWNELHAQQPEVAKKFYPALFGWTVKDSPEYTEWHIGGRGIGGMIQAHGPHTVWVPYFAVDDCDASVARAKANGATVYVAPQDIPDVGRFSVMGDPQGAMFCVIRLELRPKA